MIKQQDFFQIFIPLLVVFGVCDANAAVVQRASVSRAQVAARAPVVSSVVADDVVTVEETVVDTTVDVVEKPVFEFEDKTNQFDSAIGASSGTASGAVSDDDLAKMIRQQRAAADASSATKVSANAARSGAVSGQNACDIGLRKCMSAKCGNDFAKCAGDTDMVWGSKMDLCRRDLKCSGHEYSVFTAEIKADRDANAKLANFNAIVDCGNRYNSCIVNECGATFSKCVGKSAGDTAIAKCKKIQTECNKQDNGLAARMMNVFATVRQDAEKQILRDEKRLYELRELMASACRGMGAMFDERSLDCVYTVNFFADNSSTPYASKKSYAGGVFSCEPGWFGIDVTTFKENAYRLTRAQTAASSAMLGAGVGVAAGAISSGAIDRAIETKKAKNALKEAEKDDQKPTDDDIADNDEDTKPGAAARRCSKAGGNWDNGECSNAQCDDGKEWSNEKNKCVTKTSAGQDNNSDSGTKSESAQDNNKGTGSKENLNATQVQGKVVPGGNNANQKTTNGRNAVAKAETENVTDETTVESGDKKGLGDKKRTNNNTSDTKEERQSNRKGTKVTEENLYGPTRSMEKEEKSQARIRCENSDGNWHGEYCRCPVGTKLDEKGRCKKQSLQERCKAVGGSVSGDKCSCRSKLNENNMMLTKDPEQDCIPQTFAWSSDGVSESASEPPQETVAPEQKTENSKNDDEKKKVLSNMQKRACKNSGGNVNADSTLCSCKDRNGRSVETNNPITKCVKPKEDKKSAEAGLEKADPKGTGNEDNANAGGDINDIDWCRLDVEMEYGMDVSDQKRYKEILADLKAQEERKYNECLDLPLGEDKAGDFTCNWTIPYTITAGDKVQDVVPEPCRMFYCSKEDETFLAFSAREQFLEEMIEQECK